MITLQELINYFKENGVIVNDLEIIELFFIKNHWENEAIKMLGRLVEIRTKSLNEKISYFKENLISCESILFNENVSEEDKRDLFNLVTKFTYICDLDEDDLNKVKQILSRSKVKYCPIYFGAYLKTKGIVIDGWYYDDYQQEMLEKVIERRDDAKENKIRTNE